MGFPSIRKPSINGYDHPIYCTFAAHQDPVTVADFSSQRLLAFIVGRYSLVQSNSAPFPKDGILPLHLSANIFIVSNRLVCTESSLLRMVETHETGEAVEAAGH